MYPGGNEDCLKKEFAPWAHTILYVTMVYHEVIVYGDRRSYVHRIRFHLNLKRSNSKGQFHQLWLNT